MDSQHIVEKAVFDISFSSEDEAFAQQAVLSTFVNNEVMAEIDGVFNDFTDIHSVLRINHLEVDLGVVSYQNYQAEITARLKERLSVRLRELQAITRSHGGEGVLSIERRFSELETLHHFIRYGHLPWYSQTHSVAVMQKKFMNVVELQCEDLIRLLVSMPSLEDALDNLAEVLSLEGLTLIARQLLRKEFDSVLKILAQLADYQLSHGSFKRISRQNRDTSLRDLWRDLIAVLLHTNGTNRNITAAIRIFLMRCVGENLFQFEKMRIALLQSGFDDLSDISRFFDDHVIEINELNPERLISVSSLICVLAGNDAVELRTLWRSVLSDDKRRVGEKISAQWQPVLETHSVLLLHLVRIYGYKTAIRHTLIRALSSNQLRELVGMLAPLSKKFARDVVTLFSGVSSSGPFSDVDKPSNLCDEHLLWGFTLDFILVENGSRFNKKEYCGSLLRKMAAHNNCSYGELLDVMQSWFLAIAERHCVTQDLLSIINELTENFAQLSPVKFATASSPESEFVELSQPDVADVVLLKMLSEKISESPHESALTSVTCANEEELKKLFALIFGKRFYTISSCVISLINAITLCLEKEQREKVQLEALIFSCRYFSSGADITPEAFIRLLANHLMEESGFDEPEHLYARVILQLNQTDANRPVAQDVINNLSGNDVAVVKILSEKISESPHESALASVTCVNEEELKKLFALIFGKRFYTISSCVISLINAITLCLGKEQREKVQLEALIFSCRYFSSGADITPEAFIRLLANHLMEESEFDEPEHLYARVISQLNQTDADRPVAQKIIKNLSAFVFPHFENTPPPPVVTKDSLFNDATFYINNAGQVLLTPYLPILFERLGLIERGQFIEEEARTRAVYALQYMVDGVGGLPEYMMILNKLICGVESGRLTVRNAVISDSEKELIDGLLAAAIENWQGLGHTSVNGLRESFLKREGKLQLTDNQWHLLVETRSYDMLLDRMPWNYSTIKHAWMERVIHVEWR